MTDKEKLECIKYLHHIADRVRLSDADDTTKQRIYSMILNLLDEILRL